MATEESEIYGSPASLYDSKSFRDGVYPPSNYIVSIKTCFDDGLSGDMSETSISSIQTEVANTLYQQRKWNRMHGTHYARKCRKLWLESGNCIRKVKIWADRRGVRRLDFISNKQKTYTMGIEDWPLPNADDGSRTVTNEAHMVDFGEDKCLVGIKGHVNNDDNGSMSALGFIFREFPDNF